MKVRILLAGLYVDYRRSTLTLQSLIITKNGIAAHLYRSWDNLDYDSMLKDLNYCNSFKYLKRIYYDQYAISSQTCKKFDKRFRAIPVDHKIRCEMVEMVNSLASVISFSDTAPVKSQLRHSRMITNTKSKITVYLILDEVINHAEAFLLAVYGARKTILQYTQS